MSRSRRESSSSLSSKSRRWWRRCCAVVWCADLCADATSWTFFARLMALSNFLTFPPSFGCLSLLTFRSACPVFFIALSNFLPFLNPPFRCSSLSTFWRACFAFFASFSTFSTFPIAPTTFLYIGPKRSGFGGFTQHRWKEILTLQPWVQHRPVSLTLLLERLGFLLFYLQRVSLSLPPFQRLCYRTWFSGFSMHDTDENANAASLIRPKKLGSRTARSSDASKRYSLPENSSRSSRSRP